VKDIFRGFSLLLVTMFLVFSVRDHSGAGINEIGQSLKKDTVSSKAIKQPAKTTSKTKTKPTEIKATINEVFKKYATSKDLFFKKLFSKYLKNTPIVKIDKASQSFKTLETNFNSKKLNQPKVTAPLKIGQRAPVEGITPIADFPNFEADPNDTLEIEGIKDVNDIYNNSDYFFSGTFYDALIKINTFESMMPSFCEKYSKYPHVCAMLKFYCAEIRALIFSAPQYGVYYDGYKFQELYTQIDETYSKETGPKEAIFKKLSEVCKERINYISSDINTGIGPKISENKATLSFLLDVIKKIKENKGVVDVIYNANGEGIKLYRIGDLKLSSFGTGIYDTILLTYSQIIKDYCAMRKFDEANTVLKDLNTFYLNEYPAKIQYNLLDVDEHQFGTENYTIKRDTTTYTDLLKKYMDWNSQYGEIAENGEVFQNKVTEIINNVNSYQFDESKDNISLQEFDNIKIKFPNKSDEGNDGYYSKTPTITSLYFTKTEYAELQQSEITDPFETLCLRAQISSSNMAPLYAVKVKVNSSISEHEKLLNLKRDFITGSYFCSFQANSREQENMKDNLIDIDPRQMNPEPLPEYPADNEESPTIPPTEPPASTISQPILISTAMRIHNAGKVSDIRSISVAQCKEGGPDMALKVPPLLYIDGTQDGEHKYFNKALVRSYLKQETEDVVNNVCPNSKEFMMSGGGEYIQAGKKQPNDEFIGSSKILVKRVANWFIIQGHGAPGSPIPAEDDDSVGGDGKWVKPIELKYTASDGAERSKYEGMDVLILDTCYNLRYNRYKRWRKILPKGVILGYHGEVGFPWMGSALNMLLEELKKNPSITQEQLGTAWQEINKKIFDDSNYFEQIKGPWSYGYILPHPTDPKKNIYHSGDTCLVGSSLMRKSVPNPEKDF